MKILLRSMRGLGDNVHARAVVRTYLAQGHEVAIETPWPEIFTDLPVKIFLPGDEKLRTQRVNIIRNSVTYPTLIDPLPGYVEKKVWWFSEDVRKFGTIPRAMLAALKLPVETPDFSFTFSDEAKNYRNRWHVSNVENKPILVYRPLVERSEWGGCTTRNPNAYAYEQIYNHIRASFFVVSVADLMPGVEWISSRPAFADLEFHKGELSPAELIALFSLAGAVMCSPGFSLPLAQMVTAPVICVFGARENSTHYEQSSNFLGIDPVTPCAHFKDVCECDKTINIPDAIAKVKTFLKGIL